METGKVETETMQDADFLKEFQKLTGRVPAKPKRSEQSKDELVKEVFGVSWESRLDKIVLADCQSQWPLIAGPLSKHSWPHRVVGNRLVVRIEKSVYVYEFTYYKHDILKKIQEQIARSPNRISVEVAPIEWANYHNPANLEKKLGEMNRGQGASNVVGGERVGGERAEGVTEDGKDKLVRIMKEGLRKIREKS